MLKLLSRREKTIIVATALVIAGAVVFKLVGEPLLSRNSQLDSQLRYTRQKLKKYQQLLAQKETLESRYKDTTAVRGIVEPGADPGVGILTWLQQLASTSGVRILELRPQTPKRQESYREMEIELRTEATSEAYLTFMYKLEYSPLLLQIKKFQLSARTSTNLLEGSFVLSHVLLE